MEVNQASCCHEEVEEKSNDTKEYLKFALVLVGITATAVIWFLNSDSSGALEFLRMFMSLFLIVFAAFKFLGYQAFIDGFTTYDLVAKKYKSYALAFPFVELALGLMFLIDTQVLLRSIVLMVIMGIGSIGVFKSVFLERNKIRCACLGGIINLPLSTVSLVENTLMATMAAVMLINLP